MGCDGRQSLLYDTCEPIDGPQWARRAGRRPCRRASWHPLAIARDLPAKLALPRKLQSAAHEGCLDARQVVERRVPKISVDPETLDVFGDGVLATCEPAREVVFVCVARRYMLR